MLKTFKKGDTITKVRTESLEQLNRSINEILDVLNSDLDDIMNEFYNPATDEYEIDVMASATPNGGDAFDERIGNIIAYRKTRIALNNKKRNFIRKIYKAFMEASDTIKNMDTKYTHAIAKDLKYINKHYK